MTTSRLADSTSPYLRQHADNPVDWWPWCEAAFAEAVAQDKPVLLSVGYSACHWCHVMAHESFEDPDTAALMNANFINIKVDREERPDVDEVYQKALALLGQGGGWPLTIFLTPDQKPFFGGTYFAPVPRHGRPGFPELLAFIAGTWADEREKIDGFVEQFERGYAEMRDALDGASAGGSEQVLGDPEGEAEAERRLLDRADLTWGGFGNAPKFPNAPMLRWLLTRVAAKGGAGPIAGVLRSTLDRMARGGIHDHLGGGFARYAVDRQWRVPHFEKMLYDNAQLMRLYAEAAALWGDDPELDPLGVLRSIQRHLLDDMRGPEGLFFAATDADSEGEEGTFFVWTPAEIEAELGPERAETFCRVYGVTAEGNFESGKSVLWLEQPLGHWARELGLTRAALEARLSEDRAKLAAARARRPAPARDEKVLTAWNALAVRGFVAAAVAFEAAGADEEAARCDAVAEEVMRALFEGQVDRSDGLRVMRARFEGRAHTLGVLEDYAALGLAALDLHERRGAPEWLGLAGELAEAVFAHFARPGGGFFSTDARGERLFERPESVQDGSVPSGLALAVELLGRLSQGPKAVAAARAQLEKTAERFGHIYAQPLGHGALLDAGRQLAFDAVHVGLRGPAPTSWAQWRDDPRVRALWKDRRQSGRASTWELQEGASADAGGWAALVCRAGRCALPEPEVEGLLALLRGGSGASEG